MLYYIAANLLLPYTSPPHALHCPVRPFERERKPPCPFQTHWREGGREGGRCRLLMGWDGMYWIGTLFGGEPRW
jgi:hypothetical protein